ncbi:MAG: ABC-three component system protein [Brevundimonas sp.]
MSSEGLSQVFAEPRPQSAPEAVLDIFFVHGLGGDRIGTWQQSEDTFWPRWLAEQFPSCRVYIVGYDSNKLAGILSGEGASIQDLALAMIDQIASREEGAPHSLLVAHSLGGLIVKQLLRRCADSANTDFNTIGRSVAGVAFLGTPHQGSQFTTSLDVLLRQFKSKQSKQITYSDDALIDLNDYFRTWVSRQGAAVRSFYETQKTYGFQIVDKVTANPGIVGSDPIAIQTNHIDICKPESKTAPVYTSMCAMIRQILKKVSPEPSSAGSASGGDSSDANNLKVGRSTAESDISVAPEVLADFEFYTTLADHDRRDLSQKLTDAGRAYAVPAAKRKKERFNMALRRHIAQPSAVTRYTQLLSDVESRFNRHVARVIAEKGSAAEVDQAVQDQVIAPCAASHSSEKNEITAGLVDGALYYLAGNCHLAWDNG